VVLVALLVEVFRQERHYWHLVELLLALLGLVLYAFSVAGWMEDDLLRTLNPL
jgi:hypothetical protein